jgi:hypothetical protein
VTHQQKTGVTMKAITHEFLDRHEIESITDQLKADFDRILNETTPTIYIGGIELGVSPATLLECVAFIEYCEALNNYIDTLEKDGRIAKIGSEWYLVSDIENATKEAEG